MSDITTALMLNPTSSQPEGHYIGKSVSGGDFARETIFRDLLISRTTASGIIEHTGLSSDAVLDVLIDEEIAGTILCRHYKSGLKSLAVWQLTERGKEIAAALPVVPVFFPEN